MRAAGERLVRASRGMQETNYHMVPKDRLMHNSVVVGRQKKIKKKE